MSKFVNGLLKISKALSGGIKFGMNACVFILFGGIAWGLFAKLYFWSTADFPWIRQFGGMVGMGVVVLVALKLITRLVLRIAVKNQ